jgi:diguanylate cyclase (GGDEF)-like protein/PAS domain S-box-containing protein
MRRIGSRADHSPANADSENCRRERLHLAERAALQSVVLREQVRILYESPVVLLVSLTVTVLVAISLRGFYPGWLGVAWVGLIVVIASRLYDSWRYRRTPQQAEAFAPSWAVRFTVGAIATGCLLGVIGSVLLLASDPAHLGFIASVVGGLTAAAAVSNSAYLPAMIGFLAPIASPAILVLFSLATPMSIAMGLVASVCSAALFGRSLHTNRWITSLSKRQIAQTVLAGDLKGRNELLHAVSIAAKELLAATNKEMAIAMVLETVGEAARVDRMIVFENQTTPVGALARKLRYAWNSPQAPAILDAPAMRHMPDASGDPWFAPLRTGSALNAFPKEMPDGAAKSIFLSLGIRAILLVPIAVDGKHWGHIGLDDCTTEREWNSAELDILRTVADMIGSAIVGQRHVESLKNANTIVESSPTVLFRLRGDPSLPLVYISHNVTMYGYEPAAMLASPLFYQTIIHPDDALRVMELLAQVAMKGSKAAEDEFRMRSKDGAYIWLECLYTPIRDVSGRLLEIEGLLSNITERKEAADKITVLAMTDALTGLANRTVFIDRLRQAFAAAQRGAPPFAILYLDLDGFKNINDTLGHSAGDLLLKSVGERLTSCVRETDLVARLGGDEFAVLQATLGDVAVAGVLASKIHDALSAPYTLGGTEMRITVSIGISPHTTETMGPDEMLVQADIALYRAKDEGRNQYCFHTPDLDHEAHERVALAGDLRHAVERDDELELYFQPQVELVTGLIVGMEGLIRWNHPTRGLLQPTDFLPFVETTPVIVTVGEWVLDHACEQMSDWRQAGIAPSILAVNLSLKQLQTGEKLVGAITQILAKWGISPTDLELDVTESMLAHITLHKNPVLARLHQLGVRIAIDDFGTQYSSLDYLKTYRVSRVKIPPSLIYAAMQDREASAMVRAIIALGRELGIDVVAQGVETEQQRDLLSCAPSPTKVQGFYYSAPVPAAAATELLRQRFVEPRGEVSGKVAA